jgi:hypothetical protein
MSERYVLHHDGTWCYFLGETVNAYMGAEVLADGQPMTTCDRRGWYSADHEASVIEIRKRRAPLVTGYLIRDPATVSGKFPQSMTRDEAAGLDSDLLAQLYDRVTEEREPETVLAEGPWLRLEGESAQGDSHAGRTWRAELPYELRHHPEYLHLFPGYLPGFREHMKQVADKLPRVRYAFDRTQHHQQASDLEVTLEIPFDKPQAEYQPARNLDGKISRSRKGHMVPVMATRKLEFAVPYRIDGRNRAEAVAGWDRREAEIVAAITSATIAACSACGGHGYVAASPAERAS